MRPALRPAAGPAGRVLHSPQGRDLLSRINTDIDGIDDVVTDTVFGPVSRALITAAMLALMVRFSGQRTLAVLVMIPSASCRARSATQQQRGQMTAYLQEILGISGILLVSSRSSRAFSARSSASSLTTCAGTSASAGCSPSLTQTTVRPATQCNGSRKVIRRREYGARDAP